MKVDFSAGRPEPSPTFGGLASGDAFTTMGGGYLLIKVPEFISTGCKANAIYLHSGSHAVFQDNTTIMPRPRAIILANGLGV